MGWKEVVLTRLRSCTLMKLTIYFTKNIDSLLSRPCAVFCTLGQKMTCTVKSLLACLSDLDKACSWNKNGLCDKNA